LKVGETRGEELSGPLSFISNLRLQAKRIAAGDSFIRSG